MLENEVKMQIPSHSTNESFARMAITAFFAQLDPTIDEIADIKTAVSEAVTNCIVHAYANEIGIIHIHAKIFSDRRVYVRIRDKGCGIQDIKQAMEPMFTTCNNGERAGLGFAVMQSFMDKVRVTSKPEKGTTVVLIKKLRSRDSQA